MLANVYLRTIKHRARRILPICLAAFLFHLAGAPANAWELKSPMPTPREGAVAGVIQGKLYVIGGQAASGYVDTCEMYNPASDSWSTLPSPPLAFYRAGAAVISDKLYVVHFGGLYVFDPSLPEVDQWQQKATPPYPHYFESAAVGAINGKLYIAGGSKELDGTHTSTRCFEYDPVADTWTQKASMQGAREASASAVHNGKLYVFGGFETTSFGGPLSHTGDVQAAADSPDDGYHKGTCEVYDPVADSWTYTATLPVVDEVPQYRLFSTAQVLGNKIYLVGGENSGTVTVGSTLEYDPATDTWATEFPTEFPISVPRRALVSGVIDERMYVVGGYNHWHSPQTFYDENEELAATLVPVTMSSFSVE